MFAIPLFRSVFSKSFKHVQRKDLGAKAVGIVILHPRYMIEGIVGPGFVVKTDEAIDLFGSNERIIAAHADDVIRIRMTSGSNIAAQHVQFLTTESDDSQLVRPFL